MTAPEEIERVADYLDRMAPAQSHDMRRAFQSSAEQLRILAATRINLRKAGSEALRASRRPAGL